jgi:N-acetylmuramoyl-L-alanine amidase
MTDLDLIASLSDRNVIACTLFGEARGESPQGRIAVANVIGNRAKGRKGPWSAALRAVCLQPYQFSCWTPAGGKGNYQTVIAAARHLSRQELVGPLMRDCLAIADALIAKGLPSLVGNATHYYSPAAMIPKDSVPKWARGVEPVAEIGGSKFYEVA